VQEQSGNQYMVIRNKLYHFCIVFCNDLVNDSVFFIDLINAYFVFYMTCMIWY